MRRSARSFDSPIRIACLLIAVCALAVLTVGCADDDGAPSATQPPSSATGTPAPTESATTTPAPSPTVEGSVRAMQPITASDGWVLNDEGLWFTTDGGRSWADVTPDGVGTALTRTGLPANYVSAVTFIDAERGWLSFRGQEDAMDGFDLMIDVTVDGGQSWRTVRIADASTNSGLSPASHIHFLDPDHGWIVWIATTSSNFSGGVLYRTTDGGDTWEKLTIPLGEPVSFANENDGFVVGGAGGGNAFVTHDGGESWQPLDLPMPAEYETEFVTLSAPTFLADGRGVLPITFPGEPSAFGYFTTADSGKTWEFARAIGVTDITGVGVAEPADVVEPSTVILAELSGNVLFTSKEGHEWSSVSSSRLPDHIYKIDFVDESNGWATVVSSGCRSFKSDCWMTSQVFKTSDGGRTWEPLSPG